MPAIKANGIELFYDEAGDAHAPVIILIMGLGTQMIAWPDAFVQGLAAQGFRVIRFDNRDIGLSTHLHGAPTPNLIWTVIAARLGLSVGVAYSLSDMAADTIGLMDALGIQKAHIAGASMGGMIAQNVAAYYPDRVSSLISIMSSSGAAGLPGPTAELRNRMMKPRPDATRRDEAIAAGTEMQKLISFDDPARAPNALEQLVTDAFDRAYHPVGARRQLLAILTDTGRPARLAKVKAPTLVIHGASDPLVPLACSVDISKRISGSKLEVIEAMAHDLPPSQIGHMVSLIAEHAKAA